MAVVKLSQVVKRYGSATVIHGVDLDIAHGQFIVFVGPSGCGKSTLLRMIAGLEEISGGEISIDGQRMNEVPPAKREIAMVFQSYALYPHMSVYQNLSFGLETAGMKRALIDERVQRAARMLKIEDYLARKPRALSGGQRQRVAIGRAIVREPRLFLFDEPLSNLDAELRVQMRVELSKLHAELGATMIYVTHDQVEAMTMADRIVVLRDGLIEQIGSPLDLYNHPANRFVAGFIGSPKMNFLEVTAGAGDAEGLVVRLSDNAAIRVPRPAKIVADGTALTVGIRPEHVELRAGGVPLHVTLTEQLGGNTVLYGTLPGGQPLVAQVTGQSAVSRGDSVSVHIPQMGCHLFAGDGRTMTR